MERPGQVLVVTTGNVTNDTLLSLIGANLDAVEAALQEAVFVEVGADRIVVHRSTRGSRDAG